MPKRAAEDVLPTTGGSHSRTGQSATGVGGGGGRTGGSLSDGRTGLREPLLPHLAPINASSHASTGSAYSTLSPSRNASGSGPFFEHKALPLVDELGDLNIELRGFPKLKAYAGDMFHTLVNVRNSRFYLVLSLTYFVLFGSFALFYWREAYRKDCIPGVFTYKHAFWFSVQTAMTIGYGGTLTPDPDCFLVNLVVTLQSVVSLLLAYSLLGVVYARFAKPTGRVSTVVFSQHMVLHEEDGVPQLAIRVANLRRHQIIEVNARMLVALDNVLSADHESVFRFTQLPVLGGSQKFLGLPCVIAHPITRQSPLHGMSFLMMERCDMEILVLLEGTDASTSAKLQARHSYKPGDIRYNHRFTTIVTRSANGLRCVDFTKFHCTVPVHARPTISPAFLAASDGASSGGGSSTGTHHPRVSRQLSDSKLPPILQFPRALGAPDNQLKVEDSASSSYARSSLSIASSSDDLPGLAWRAQSAAPPQSDGESCDDIPLRPNGTTAVTRVGGGPRLPTVPSSNGGLFRAGGGEMVAEAPGRPSLARVASARRRLRDPSGIVKHSHHHHHHTHHHTSGRTSDAHNSGEDSHAPRQHTEMERTDAGNDPTVEKDLEVMEVEFLTKSARASEKARHWRQMVIELAARVQQCPRLKNSAGQQPTARVQDGSEEEEFSARSLMECAQDALDQALTYLDD